MKHIDDLDLVAFQRQIVGCGQTGRTGPTQAQCDTAYAGGGPTVTVTGGIQAWTVPSSRTS